MLNRAKFLFRAKEEVNHLQGELKDARQRLRRRGEQLTRLKKRLEEYRGNSLPTEKPDSNNADYLQVSNKNTESLYEPRFVEAYARGINSGHKYNARSFSKPGMDLFVKWRVHLACWAAWHAKHLPGSFVECGVSTGIMSLAICDYIDFNSLDKDFYLFDTFCGIPEEQMSLREKPARIATNERLYEESYKLALGNFEPFPRAHLIRGKVPDTLNNVDIEEVCYLCIDMNIAEPERAAIEHFWPKLVSGAPVLLDDYAMVNHEPQKEAMDEFASKKGVKILTVPTGQGLLMKP